jgi:3-phytase
VGDVYGFCLWRRAADQVFAVIAFNNGDVREYALDLSSASPTAALVRDVKLDTKTEGCVVDDRTGLLYVAEEKRGVWRMNAAPDSRAAPVLFAAVDGVRLIPDVEGLTLAPKGARGGVLIASSQNDNAYVAYDLESGRYLRRFRIAGSGAVDAVTDTDGLEFAPGDFGAPFKDGLLVVQDGDNAPDKQNFKLVPGGALKRLLRSK